MKTFKNDDNQKKQRQLDNLTNLVEKHTRTKRHLEQYSNIGNPDNKEKAKQKQETRAEEMQNLKNKLITGNKQTPQEMLEDTKINYKATGRYVANNYDNIPKENLENIQEKQKNRKMQIKNFEEEQ